MVVNVKGWMEIGLKDEIRDLFDRMVGVEVEGEVEDEVEVEELTWV